MCIWQPLLPVFLTESTAKKTHKSSSLLDNFDCLWLYRLERLYNVGVEGVVLGEAGGCSCCAAHYQLWLGGGTMACWPGGAAADTPSIAKHPCGAGKEEEVKVFLDSASLSFSSSTNNGGPSAKERGSLNQSYPPFLHFRLPCPPPRPSSWARVLNQVSKRGDLWILCLPTSVWEIKPVERGGSGERWGLYLGCCQIGGRAGEQGEIWGSGCDGN